MLRRVGGSISIRVSRVVVQIAAHLICSRLKSGSDGILGIDKSAPSQVSFSELRKKIESDRPPIILLFGTGFGAAREILTRADLASRRSAALATTTTFQCAAAAAILDPLRGISFSSTKPS
jgi:hypothetical protein